MNSMASQLDVRIVWGDCDEQGIVFYPKYFYWMDSAFQALLRDACQSAFKFDPRSASNFDPLDRCVRAVALAPSELVGVAETARARVGV